MVRVIGEDECESNERKLSRYWRLRYLDIKKLTLIVCSMHFFQLSELTLSSACAIAVFVAVRLNVVLLRAQLFLH